MTKIYESTVFTGLYEPDLTNVERKLIDLVLQPRISSEVKALRIRTILGDVRQHVLIAEVEGYGKGKAMVSQAKSDGWHDGYFDGFAEGLAKGLGEKWSEKWVEIE